jgi:hypothetical protein
LSPRCLFGHNRPAATVLPAAGGGIEEDDFARPGASR